MCFGVKTENVTEVDSILRGPSVPIQVCTEADFLAFFRFVQAQNYLSFIIKLMNENRILFT